MIPCHEQSYTKDVLLHDRREGNEKKSWRECFSGFRGKVTEHVAAERGPALIEYLPCSEKK